MYKLLSVEVFNFKEGDIGLEIGNFVKWRIVLVNMGKCIKFFL